MRAEKRPATLGQLQSGPGAIVTVWFEPKKLAAARERRIDSLASPSSSSAPLRAHPVQPLGGWMHPMPNLLKERIAVSTGPMSFRLHRFDCARAVAFILSKISRGTARAARGSLESVTVNTTHGKVDQNQFPGLGPCQTRICATPTLGSATSTVAVDFPSRQRWKTKERLTNQTGVIIIQHYTSLYQRLLLIGGLDMQNGDAGEPRPRIARFGLDLFNIVSTGQFVPCGLLQEQMRRARSLAGLQQPRLLSEHRIHTTDPM
ncbi:hypothetical protein ASPVEDRAFT_880585 [Aspergillus versicolor CBS 583.65]|uniref:Uncharacterized protein n=1 Tax=Aspergillus versicolor CBS 583.65 TaxID=1036611 RepID=A0A1L9P977_ASPVE|nr:uncharacterized protein ASPVEDRAFT_880585 [Aspergillus versicolor CBS 583.65]OJI98071.1 hypothetical protein ASPVEDRAFT_880585 [Aspergillus versicolor CBS 583.65]